MPNQPKTPVTNFRLTEVDRDRLNRIATTLGATMTDAAKTAIESLDNLMHAWRNCPQTDDRRKLEGATWMRLCPLGLGHTAHVWELPTKINANLSTAWPPSTKGEPRRYLCVGEPFADGYEPYDDLHHINAYVTTNPPRVEWVN